MTPQPITDHTAAGADILSRQARLVQDMDRVWDRTARQYGFVCHGCDDNCCRSLFYHHTLVEFSFLAQGLANLDETVRQNILRRASGSPDPGLNGWCPLNNAGRCRLYAFRPMICRLHGLPHELVQPGKGRIRGPGCHDFVRQCGILPYISLDRTPLYVRLAEIERDARALAGFTGRIRWTIAEMIRHLYAEETNGH